MAEDIRMGTFSNQFGRNVEKHNHLGCSKDEGKAHTVQAIGRGVLPLTQGDALCGFNVIQPQAVSLQRGASHG